MFSLASISQIYSLGFNNKTVIIVNLYVIIVTVQLIHLKLIKQPYIMSINRLMWYLHGMPPPTARAMHAKRGMKIFMVNCKSNSTMLTGGELLIV